MSVIILLRTCTVYTVLSNSPGISNIQQSTCIFVYTLRNARFLCFVEALECDHKLELYMYFLGLKPPFQLAGQDFLILRLLSFRSPYLKSDLSP